MDTSSQLRARQKLRKPRLTASTIANVLGGAAITFIPLMYGGTLSSAYQDPVERIGHIRAAVVNEDQPYRAELVSGKSETIDVGTMLTDALFNLRISADSSVETPGRFPSSTCVWLTHLRSVSLATPNRGATSRITADRVPGSSSLSRSRTMRTARSLNDCSYFTAMNPSSQKGRNQTRTASVSIRLLSLVWKNVGPWIFLRNSVRLLSL